MCFEQLVPFRIFASTCKLNCKYFFRMETSLQVSTLSTRPRGMPRLVTESQGTFSRDLKVDYGMFGSDAAVRSEMGS